MLEQQNEEFNEGLEEDFAELDELDILDATDKYKKTDKDQQKQKNTKKEENFDSIMDQFVN